MRQLRLFCSMFSFQRQLYLILAREVITNYPKSYLQ